MRRIVALASALVACASWSAAQAPRYAPLELVHTQGSSTPAVLTLQDALQRARQNDAQFQTAVADADVAREDRVQARAGLLPSLSNSTQFIGNSPNGINPNGRFISMDGVQMYREWAVVHQDLSANTLRLTPIRKAQAEEAAAQARREVAQRGLAVTVTRSYYALVVAQRKYATAQEAAQQSSRFFDMAQQQQRLGQVARADVIKAEIQDRQQLQAFREAQLAMDGARIALAVLVSPTIDENFTVVDDLTGAQGLPPFADIREMAGRGNPDVQAADAALRAAAQDVQLARNAFFPNASIEWVYGIEANEFALHSRIAAQPELGVLPNLGYAITAVLTIPVWDWGTMRSKLHQTQTRQRQAQSTLSQAQRQVMGSLYTKYNEALTARAAVENLQRVAELATESLRLTLLRYQAGESTALEVVDAQNTLVQARDAADDAAARHRVALADLQTLTGPF